MSTTNEELTAEELADLVERRRRYVEQDLDAIGDRVSPSRIRERTGQRARRRLHDVRNTVMGSVDDVSTRAGDAAGEATGRVQAAEEQMEQRVKGNPFGAGLVAFGIGYLIGSVLPGSRRERQMARQVEPVLAEVASEAADVAHDVADDLKPAAQEEIGAMKGEAADAASNVREQM